MPDTTLLPVVQKHDMFGREDRDHWDVQFPCCEALGAVNFPTEAAACAVAEAHKCEARQDTPKEARQSAVPMLDLDAVRRRLRAYHQKTQDTGSVVLGIDAPNLLAAIERVQAVAVELAESGNTVMSAKRASDLIVQALNLKEN